MKAMHRVGRWAGAAAAAVLLTGCGDANPGLGPILEFDPEPSTERVRSVLEPISSNDNLWRGLDAAATALAAFGDDEGGDGTAGFLAPTVAFPPEVVGRVLIYDPELQRYVVDEEAEDAPAGGVRVTHYSIGESGLPIVPLEVRGYIDLTDASASGWNRMRVVAVSTGDGAATVLADYVVGVRGAGTLQEGELEFTADGLLRGTGGAVNVDLSQAYTWSESAGTETLELDYGFGIDGHGPVSFNLTGTGEYQANYFDPIHIVVALTEDHGSVVVDVEMEGSAVDGEIVVDGTRMIVIGGVEPNVTFTWADGAPVAGTQAARLRGLWSAVVDLLVVPERAFVPIEILYLLG